MQKKICSVLFVVCMVIGVIVVIAKERENNYLNKFVNNKDIVKVEGLKPLSYECYRYFCYLEFKWFDFNSEREKIARFYVKNNLDDNSILKIPVEENIKTIFEFPNFNFIAYFKRVEGKSVLYRIESFETRALTFDFLEGQL